MKLVSFNQESLRQSVETLKQGGIVAHPADTCYGLVADLMNKAALESLQKIKKRDKNKPMSIMLPVFMKSEINQYANLDDFSEFVCNELLPGPVTLILPRGQKIPDFYFPKSPYVGLRIPYDMETQDILINFGGPLITTSANISDGNPFGTGKETKEIFENETNKPDLIFNGVIKNNCMPSTVILVNKNNVKIMRKGPMTKDQLEDILGVKVS